MKVERIKELLSTQADTMLEFGEQEQRLQDAILKRDWSAVDALVSSMEITSSTASTLDRRRHDLLLEAKREIGLREDASFGEFLEHVAEDDRRELGTLYRSLQVSVLRVKSVTRGIDSFVRGSLRTTNEVLGTVFPDQKGTMYSRRGHRAPTDGRAMVIDRHL